MSFVSYLFFLILTQNLHTQGRDTGLSRIKILLINPNSLADHILLAHSVIANFLFGGERAKVKGT